MNSQKEKIIEFAKGLFLQVDENGHKAVTFEGISQAIHKKFKKEAHYSTIVKWSKKFDWAGTYEKIKMSGIEKAQITSQEKESKLVDEKADVIAEIYKNNKTILNLSKNHLFAKLTGQQMKDKDGNPIDPKMYTADLIRLMEHSEATLLNLHDKPQKDTQQIPQITIQCLNSDIPIKEVNEDED